MEGILLKLMHQVNIIVTTCAFCNHSVFKLVDLLSNPLPHLKAWFQKIHINSQHSFNISFRPPIALDYFLPVTVIFNHY